MPMRLFRILPWLLLLGTAGFFVASPAFAGDPDEDDSDASCFSFGDSEPSVLRAFLLAEAQRLHDRRQMHPGQGNGSTVAKPRRTTLVVVKTDPDSPIHLCMKLEGPVEQDRFQPGISTIEWYFCRKSDHLQIGLCLQRERLSERGAALDPENIPASAAITKLHEFNCRLQQEKPEYAGLCLAAQNGPQGRGLYLCRFAPPDGIKPAGVQFFSHSAGQYSMALSPLPIFFAFTRKSKRDERDGSLYLGALATGREFSDLERRLDEGQGKYFCGQVPDEDSDFDDDDSSVAEGYEYGLYDLKTGRPAANTQRWPTLEAYLEWASGDPDQQQES